MLRYSCLQSTVVVAAMALLVLLAVAVNGLPSRPENSKGPMSVYSHEGHAILSRRTPPDSPKPPAQQFDVGTFNLKYRLFLTKTDIDVGTGNIFSWTDLKRFLPTIVEKLHLWETSLNHLSRWPVDLRAIARSNHSRLVAIAMFKYHYHISKEGMVIPGKINSSVIRLLADFMALREKVKSTFSGSLLQDDETEAWLSVIIGTLKTAAGNQMHRMYDITERFLQFLVEEKVAVDDLANFLAYFIRVVLTGNMPLPEESVKGLAQKFVETCLKAEETNGTTGTMGAVEPTCPSERSPKEFNDVIYNQSLDYFLEISRSTMDERLHAIGAISAQKGIA